MTTTLLRAMNTVVRPLLDVGIGNPLPIGPGVVLVESSGRKSGEARETPLLSLRVGDTLAVATLRSNSDWVANMKAEPRGRITLYGRSRVVTSDVVELARLRVALLRIRPT